MCQYWDNRRKSSLYSQISHLVAHSHKNLEFFTICFSFNHIEWLDDICKLGHLTVYRKLQIIYEQIKKNWSNNLWRTPILASFQWTLFIYSYFLLLELGTWNVLKKKKKTCPHIPWLVMDILKNSPKALHKVWQNNHNCTLQLQGLLCWQHTIVNMHI